MSALLAWPVPLGSLNDVAELVAPDDKVQSLTRLARPNGAWTAAFQHLMNAEGGCAPSDPEGDMIANLEELRNYARMDEDGTTIVGKTFKRFGFAEATAVEVNAEPIGLKYRTYPFTEGLNKGSE